MDEESFVIYLAEKKKPKNTIQSYVNRVKLFEKYLKEDKNKNLEEASKQDLKDFTKWGEENDLNVYLYFWGIRPYYKFLANDDLAFECSFLMQLIQLEKFNLSQFMDVNKEYTKMLSKIGIKTAYQILEKGKTSADRKAISQESGVPEDYILELVQLSNLARAPGHMKVRARLYYECGLDTFDKMASFEPDEMIQLVSKFINETNFQGIPPTFGDADCSIQHARRIPRIIMY